MDVASAEHPERGHAADRGDEGEPGEPDLLCLTDGKFFGGFSVRYTNCHLPQPLVKLG